MGGGFPHFGQEDELDYQVEGILNDVIHEETHLYLVKWRGYDSDQNTWETFTDLALCGHEQAVELYEAQKRGRTMSLPTTLAAIFLVGASVLVADQARETSPRMHTLTELLAFAVSFLALMVLAGDKSTGGRNAVAALFAVAAQKLEAKLWLPTPLIHDICEGLWHLMWLVYIIRDFALRFEHLLLTIVLMFTAFHNVVLATLWLRIGTLFVSALAALIAVDRFCAKSSLLRFVETIGASVALVACINEDEGNLTSAALAILALCPLLPRI